MLNNKETHWSKYNTEKREENPHDSLKKLKSEMLKDSKTIDLSQLKLDINFDQLFLKNKKEIKETESAKSVISMKESPVRNVKISAFLRFFSNEEKKREKRSFFSREKPVFFQVKNAGFSLKIQLFS